MTKFAHKFSIVLYILIILSVLVYLIAFGFSYYTLPVDKRAFHELHKYLRPSGLYGHGMGIIGSLFMLIGVTIYMLRKRVRKFARIGVLKYWLELHIFLCTLGPILVIFHTAFKFGGIVAISFWSMIAVFLSGIIGRFIYMQIPRTIQGQEIGLQELESLSNEITGKLESEYDVEKSVITLLEQSVELKTYRDISARKIIPLLWQDALLRKKTEHKINKILRSAGIRHNDRTQILKLVKEKFVLNRKIGLLSTMRKLFNLWHVIHLPFAIIMLIIMVLHVSVAIVFGYTWIF